MSEGGSCDECKLGGRLERARVIGRALQGFFFSSRRRHTRCSRDWSSDVCSSDLRMAVENSAAFGAFPVVLAEFSTAILGLERGADFILQAEKIGAHGGEVGRGGHWKIGRASCRERG